MERDNIEVGEYIRTKKGNIFKVIDGNSDNYDIDINYFKLEITEDNWFESNRYNDNGYFFDKENILKHSKNIIDLIEVGDYVNGHLIVNIEIDKNKRKIITENKYFAKYYENGIAKIETIVTKEQFKEMEYRV